MINIFWKFVTAISAVIFLWGLAGCKKIEPDSPPLSIESVRALSLTSYEVVIRLEYVDLYKISSGKIVFDDITILTESNVVKEFKVGQDRNQIDTVIVETGRITHDYYVTASAETNKGLCTSEPFLMRSQKYNFSVDVILNINYSDLKHNIADIVSSGKQFGIQVDCLIPYKPSSVEVRLNRTIPLISSLDLVNYSFAYNADCQCDEVKTTGYAYISLDIKPGIYDVYVYIDGIEFKALDKIKILPGTWTIIEPDYQGGNRGNYAWFLKGDNLYLIGGDYYNTQITESPVWQYNIPQNKWERRNDFPHPGDVTKNKIMPLNLEYNDEGYIVLKNDMSVELWKYNVESDQWSFVATYPGLGKEYLSAFITKGKLYIGAGNWNVCFMDFWAFNLETSEWIKQSDMPLACAGSMSSVTSSGITYVFSYTGEFWQYNPGSDTWTLKRRFPGHLRVFSSMAQIDDKLYVTGGLYEDSGFKVLEDCWRYSEADDTWEMMAFLPYLYGNGVSFSYQGSVYSGLGWLNNNPVFYKFDI